MKNLIEICLQDFWMLCAFQWREKIKLFLLKKNEDDEMKKKWKTMNDLFFLGSCNLFYIENCNVIITVEREMQKIQI